MIIRMSMALEQKQTLRLILALEMGIFSAFRSAPAFLRLQGRILQVLRAALSEEPRD